MFARVVSVVRRKHDDRIFRSSGFFECVEDRPNGIIEVPDHPVVHRHGPAEFILRSAVQSHNVAIDSQALHFVFQVTGHLGRHVDGFRGVQGGVGLGRGERMVWIGKRDPRAKRGFRRVGVLFQVFRGFRRDPARGTCLGRVGDSRGMSHRFVERLVAQKFGNRAGVAVGRRRGQTGVARLHAGCEQVLVGTLETVVFANEGHPVAGVGKQPGVVNPVLWHQDLVVAHASVVRVHACPEGNSRRNTQRRGDVVPAVEDPRFRKTLQIGRRNVAIAV